MKEDDKPKQQQKDKINKERFRLLKRLDRILEIPMIVLAFVWIVILVLELIRKSTPFLENFSLIIWGIFIVDFAIKFIIARRKLRFIKYNLIIIISLIIPAFRTFNILRIPWVLKLTRAFILVRLLGGMNRGMRALSMTMEKRAFGYISILTIIILFTGATGMYIFERDVNPGLDDFGSAVWWTAIILTTMGSDAWPVTAEGRILCVLLAVYAFTIFGYVTATFATFFLGEDAHSKNPDIASGPQMEHLHKQIQELKELLEKNNQRK